MECRYKKRRFFSHKQCGDFNHLITLDFPRASAFKILRHSDFANSDLVSFEAYFPAPAARATKGTPMTAAPTQASAEALAAGLNAILDRACDPVEGTDKAIATLLGIALPEDGTLYAEDVFEATKAAGLRIRFLQLEGE